MAEKNAAGNLLGIGMDYILLFWTTGEKPSQYCQEFSPRAPGVERLG
jgi:hypothetical protein